MGHVRWRACATDGSEVCDEFRVYRRKPQISHDRVLHEHITVNALTEVGIGPQKSAFGKVFIKFTCTSNAAMAGSDSSSSRI